MGSIVLLIALVIEAAFAIYCLRTQSSQPKVRSFIRIGALAAFMLFTLASVIQWSFRWYALAALLLMWAALGAWRLIRPPAEKKAYRAGRSVFSAVVMLLMVAIAVIPALILPQFHLPPATGKHAVATLNATYTYESRVETFTTTGAKRQVNVEFWYPKEVGGTYPLVVFSHGSVGMKASNTSTFMDLASNGYVVCAIDHPYHALFTMSADRHVTTVDPAILQGIVDLNGGKYDDATAFKLEHEWMALRIADIHFVLNTILARAKDSGSDPVYQLIDTRKIGLMGHSLGGESVAQVARERNDIGAVINLDADLGGEYLDLVDGRPVLNDTVYPVPLLNILADDLVRLIAAVPDAESVVAVKHVTATAPNAFEVHLTGTNHMSVTDLPLVSPFFVSVINASVPKGGGQAVDPTATLEKMNALVLQFFNVYLKGDGTFTYSGSH